MALTLFDSRARQRVAFSPIDPSHVRLYVCGPTVYDLAHVGNMRAMLVYDVLVRLLRRLYPRVTYVRNVTDVDDKINARAAELGEPIASVTARTYADFQADLAALDILPPEFEPRATGHIAEMIEVIERLIAGGHAYAAAGHVLFAVASDPNYGSLSGRDPEELLAGARIEVAAYKRDPGDFVLWKPSDAALPGWDSPWGRGRPGWHIECSAMAWRYLGTDFDIHGGGTDLLFPHHENERAQSCCAFPGSGFARLWMHSGMLLSGGEKMSKSLGNFFTAREVLARAPAEAVRLLLLKTQYRATLDFGFAALGEAKRELARFYRALDELGDQPEAAPDDAFMAALCDDLNTPLAIAVLHRLAAEARAGDLEAAGRLRASGAVLGLLQRRTRPEDPEEATMIEMAVGARREARARRDWAAADRIRDRLLADGILLEDGADGTTWRRA